MSKSKGNVEDPLEIINKYGSDALRMSLIGGTTAGLPQRHSEQKVLKYRNFVTKIWNASRFVAQITDGTVSSLPKNLDDTEKKFLAKLDKLEAQNIKLFADYKIGVAAELLYEFFWHEFADQFLEYEKQKINNETAPKDRPASNKSVLRHALKRLLVMLGDFAPFLVYQIGKTMGL